MYFLFSVVSVPGGLLVDDNPWVCDCGLVWLGAWMRRWLRESLMLHAAPIDAAQHLALAARSASCTDPRTARRTPLLDLYPEDLGCHTSALSGAAWFQRCELTYQLTVVVVLLVS